MEPIRRINKWTQDEDSVLLQKLQEQQSKNPPDKVIDWQKIAAALPGRTNKDCRKRWFNVLNGDLRKGAWTADEDKLLGLAVETEGKVWMRVSQHVPRRTADQCAKRWQHFLDPTLDRSEWTESECQILWDAVRQRGRRWLQIRNDLFPMRSPNSLKNQYAFISRHCCKSQGHCHEQSDSTVSSSPASHSEDPSINLMTEDPQQLFSSMEHTTPPPTSHDDMFILDYTLPNFGFDANDQTGLSTLDLPDTPNNGRCLQQQYSVDNDSFLVSSCPSSNGYFNSALEASAIGSASMEGQFTTDCQNSALSLESWSGLTSSHCSVMTVRLKNPAPEAVNDFIQILMAHHQQVTIDIES
ncbi:hypothetical protein McanMca71_000172 [Microsporum canis]